jgi:uncharacterized protein YjbI with pentapeptide repeats
MEQVPPLVANNPLVSNEDGSRFTWGFVLRVVGADLRGLNLANYHLSGCEFINCDMAKASFLGRT